MSRTFLSDLKQTFRQIRTSFTLNTSKALSHGFGNGFGHALPG